MKAKVIVLGGGIVGLLTAYFLNKNGFLVEVIEKRTGVGLQASLANGSQASFSHILPFNFGKKEKFSIFGNKPEVSVKINSKLPAVKNFLERQSQELLHSEKHLSSLVNLASISSNALDEFIKDEQLERFFKNCGIIHLFSSEKDCVQEVARAKTYDQPFIEVSQEGLLMHEPNIASFEKKFAGGVYYNNDKTSNCHDICKILEGILKERGVIFHLNTEIVNLEASDGKISKAVSSIGLEFQGEHFVLANGINVPEVAQTVGLSFEIFPVRGYSYTFNMEKSNYMPFIGLIDREHKMVYSIYKNYLRVAGFFDLGVDDPSEILVRMGEFEELIFKNFPLLRRNGIVHKWSENRPFTPSSVPIIGKTKEFSNLFVNSGHGALGFTLSFGSGKIISQLI